jgi:hypothetical protein
MVVVFASATTMPLLRRSHDWHLLLIATVAFGAMSTRWLAGQRHRHGWLRVHVLGMGGSYAVPTVPCASLPAMWLFGPAVVGLSLLTSAGRGAYGERRSKAP